MLVLISYDVSTVNPDGRKRLRNVAKKCENYGIRVQNSVFECNIESFQWIQLKKELEDICNPQEDSLRFYYLGKKYQTKIEHYGIKNTIDVEDPLIF